MSGYEIFFDETTYMSIVIKDKQLLKQYKKILNKIS